MTAESDNDTGGMSDAFDSLLAQSRKQFDDLFAGPDAREAEPAPQATPALSGTATAGNGQTVLLHGTADGIPFAIRLEKPDGG